MILCAIAANKCCQLSKVCLINSIQSWVHNYRPYVTSSRPLYSSPNLYKTASSTNKRTGNIARAAQLISRNLFYLDAPLPATFRSICNLSSQTNTQCGIVSSFTNNRLSKPLLVMTPSLYSFVSSKVIFHLHSTQSSSLLTTAANYKVFSVHTFYLT